MLWLSVPDPGFVLWQISVQTCLQVGEGSIAALSTGGAVSKFGFPLQVGCFAAAKFLCLEQGTPVSCACWHNSQAYSAALLLTGKPPSAGMPAWHCHLSMCDKPCYPCSTHVCEQVCTHNRHAEPTQ